MTIANLKSQAFVPGSSRAAQMGILMDPEDEERYGNWPWRIVLRDGIVNSIQCKAGKLVYLGRVILNLPDGIECDHRDCDPMNNTRANLRPATQQENSINRRSHTGVSKYKGVSWHKGGFRKKRWLATIRTQGRIMTLGYFRFQHEAARAYDTVAREHYGIFARLNFPINGEQSALK